MAVEGIWTAIQVVLVNVANRVAHAAPAGAKDPVNVAREGRKKTDVIDLMRRSQGATLAEIMELTGWQFAGTIWKLKRLPLRLDWNVWAYAFLHSASMDEFTIAIILNCFHS